MVWYGMVWYGMVWYGMVFYINEKILKFSLLSKFKSKYIEHIINFYI